MTCEPETETTRPSCFSSCAAWNFLPDSSSNARSIAAAWSGPSATWLSAASVSSMGSGLGANSL